MKKRNAVLAIVFLIAVTASLLVAKQVARYREKAYEELTVSNPLILKEVPRFYLPTTADITGMLFNERFPYKYQLMSTAPHPFAIALREYMDDYDGTVRAFLVTLDDHGTMGMLVSRMPIKSLVDYDWGEYGYGSPGTVFFMQDDVLLQTYAIGFVSGRYNRLVERFHTHTHVVEAIYKLAFGQWEISTLLSYFSDDYILYLSESDSDATARAIAEREAHAAYAREKYGLVALLPPNFGHMRNTEAQTAQILAMTINCTPQYVAATIVPPTQTDQISMVIGSSPVHFATHQPILVDGHIFAPVYEFFDLLGFWVRWHPPTQAVRLAGEVGITIYIDNNTFTTNNMLIFVAPNGEAFSTGERRNGTLEAPIKVIEGTIMVPIRGILESVGYSLHWDEVTNTITITDTE